MSNFNNTNANTNANTNTNPNLNANKSEDISNRFDPIFYKKRYNIDISDKEALERHYKKIGIKRGYHPNSEKERYYMKSLNFDPEFYKT
jgi:hypothetical protein